MDIFGRREELRKTVGCSDVRELTKVVFLVHRLLLIHHHRHLILLLLVLFFYISLYFSLTDFALLNLINNEQTGHDSLIKPVGDIGVIPVGNGEGHYASFPLYIDSLKPFLIEVV